MRALLACVAIALSAGVATTTPTLLAPAIDVVCVDFPAGSPHESFCRTSR